MEWRYGYFKREALNKYNHYTHTNYEFKKYKFFRTKIHGLTYYWCEELLHFFTEEELDFEPHYTSFLDALDKVCNI